MGPIAHTRGGSRIATMGTPIILGCPRGSCPDLKATSAPTVRRVSALSTSVGEPEAILRSTCCAPQPFRATPRGRLRLRRKGG